MHINTTLNVSICHISEAEFEHILKHAEAPTCQGSFITPDLIVYGGVFWGARLLVSEDPTEIDESAPKETCPNLNYLLHYAQAHGCRYVLIDMDTENLDDEQHPAFPHLKVHTWGIPHIEMPLPKYNSGAKA